MDVITVNVGQGALAIVRHEGEAIIVDARVPPAGATVGIVKTHLAKFLKEHSLRGLVLTGFDKDHADVVGAALIIRKYRPDWVLYPDYCKDTEEYAGVQDIINCEIAARRGSNSPLRRLPMDVAALKTRVFDGLSRGLRFEVFSPHSDDMDTSNNCSLVMRIESRGADAFSYLVTGDTENPRWESVNRFFGKSLASDVMAAPHHGGRNGTNAETLLNVSPDTILISAGVDNQYGHPDASVLRAYQRVAKTVLGTHMDGGQSLFTRRHQGEIQTIGFTDR